MPRNKSDFGEIAISPLSGQLDLRSPSGRLGLGDFRIVLNASMNEMGKRCRRSGWKKLFADSLHGFNNQDLHDQLVTGDSYTNASLPSCANPPNNCVCPDAPACLEIEDFTEEMFDDCVVGATSPLPAWNGVIPGVSACSWGFSYGQYSLNGRELAVVAALKSCTDGENRWVLTIFGKTEDGTQSITIWQGEKSGTPVGMFHRATGCASLTTLNIANCNACPKPNVTIDPPDGSIVVPGTFVALHAPAGSVIYYTTDGGDPDDTSTLYSGPFVLPDEVDTIKAIAYSGECISDIAEANYTVSEAFLFQYLCQPGEDEAGVFFEFAPNGNFNDYKWRLRFGLEDVVDIKRLEIYETNALGVWVTGQAWATDNPIYPTEMAGVPFSVYPLVIKDGGSAVNTDYETTLVEDHPVGLKNWLMYGQPFIPLTGYFKLIFTYIEADVEKKLYALISNQCECADYSYDYDYDYGYYYCYDGQGDIISPTSRGLLNVDFRRGGGVKTGAAAVGQAGDYWNVFEFPITTEEAEASGIELLWSNLDESGVTVTPVVDGGEITLEQIWDQQVDTGHSDGMMQYAARHVPNSLPAGITVSDLPRGTYDVYVYGHGANDSDILKCFLQTPFRIPPESLRPVQETDVGTGWQSGTWVEGQQYVVFRNVTWMNNEETDLQILFPPNSGEDRYYISGVQLQRIA